MSRLVNAKDNDNSTTAPLGALEEFVGKFTNVSSYASVSVSCQSDVGSSFSGLQLEWSTDGLVADLASQDFTFDPAVISQDGFTVHATVRANYLRVRYKNSGDAQSFFVLDTRVRRGAASGTIRSLDPLNTFTSNVDVQEVQALMSGTGLVNPEQIQIAKMDDINLLPHNLESYLFVSPRPAKPDKVHRVSVAAATSPVELTAGPALARKVFLSITNRVLRGNLYLKLNTGAGLSPTSYDYVVPAGHTWQDPGAFGSVYPGDVFGVWDEAYVHSPSVQAGGAEVVISFYGP